MQLYSYKDKSKVYTMALEGNDGMKVEAIAVWHLGTSKWNLKHLAFQLLKVKPRNVLIFHYMTEDHVMCIVRIVLFRVDSVVLEQLIKYINTQCSSITD